MEILAAIAGSPPLMSLQNFETRFSSFALHETNERAYHGPDRLCTSCLVLSRKMLVRMPTHTLFEHFFFVGGKFRMSITCIL